MCFWVAGGGNCSCLGIGFARGLLFILVRRISGVFNATGLPLSVGLPLCVGLALLRFSLSAGLEEGLLLLKAREAGTFFLILVSW